jgi:hypothetical protein
MGHSKPHPRKEGMTQVSLPQYIRLWACLSLFLGLVPASVANAADVAPKVEVFVLMTAKDFIEANQPFMATSQEQIDADASLATIASYQPLALEYRDPQGRFSLSYPEVGSEVNPLRLMASRASRLGDTLTVHHIEFALSSGAPYKQRVREAVDLDRYFREHGFASTSYDRFEVEADGRKLTDFRQLLSYEDSEIVPQIGGLELFTLERDELIVSVSILHQQVTADPDDFTLYMIIREKVEGVED